MSRRPLCRYFSPTRRQLEAELQWSFDYFSSETSNATECGDCRSKPVSGLDKSTPMVLLPHGAIGDSGPLVANALVELDKRSSFFHQIQTSSDRRTILLIGTEHGSMAQNFISLCGFTSWHTPIGALERDNELHQRLSTFLPTETAPFESEHSIENQLPFLRVMARNDDVEIQIVPISVRGTVTEEEFHDVIQGKKSSILYDLARVVSEYSTADNSIAILATTDYNHIGPAYGCVPPGWPDPQAESIPDYIRRNDAPILQAIVSDNVENVYSVGRQSSMCGLGAALVWIRLGRFIDEMTIKKGQRAKRSPRLLKYCVGSDIGPAHNDQTGFATFIMM